MSWKSGSLVREEPEEVFNIEVDGDHVYRVGRLGLLVHNASAPCDPAAGITTYEATVNLTFTNKVGVTKTATVGTGASAYLTPSSVGGAYKPLEYPDWWDDLRGVAGSPIQPGHILASTLAGKGGKSWDNLTPLYEKANTPAMRTCEVFIKKLVTECKYCVYYTVTVIGYGKNMSVPVAARPVMPTQIKLEVATEGSPCVSYTWVIDNIPTATTMDPCLVKNLPCRP